MRAVVVSPTEFIARINSLPKYVASTTPVKQVERHRHRRRRGPLANDLKQQPGGNIIKYGNGPLDLTLMRHGLIDEFTCCSPPSPSARANICSRTSMRHRRAD
jgi:hypothetical protein